MRLMIVWRLEDALGNGPYSAPEETRFICWDENLCDEEYPLIRHRMRIAHADEHHPALTEDFPHWNHKTEQVVFGCPTKALLEEWFGEYLQPLLELGYQIVEYELDARQIVVSKSGKQCLFPRVKPFQHPFVK